MSFAADDDLSAEAEGKLGDTSEYTCVREELSIFEKAFYMKHYGDIDGIERAPFAPISSRRRVPERWRLVLCAREQL